MTKVSKKEPLISIIVPVYKVEQYINKCIDSIINQTYKNLEIILVDDGSPDNCGSICDEYAKKDKRIKVIHKKNGGLSDARNVGINIAKGEYIGFVDSDDFINREMYAKLYKIIIEYDADIAVCELKRFHDEGKIIERVKKINTILYTQDEFLKKFFKIGSQSIEYYAHTKLYKKNMIEKEQYPVGLTSEDVLGTYKALLKAKTIVKTTDELYYYRYNEQSITGSFSKKDFDLLEIWDKVVEYTKENAPQYEDCAVINRKRINFTLLYRMAKNVPQEELDEMDIAKKLLFDLKQDEADLLKANIEFKRKILIYLFCRNYKFSSYVIKKLG